MLLGQRGQPAAQFRIRRSLRLITDHLAVRPSNPARSLFRKLEKGLQIRLLFSRAWYRLVRGIRRHFTYLGDPDVFAMFENMF